MKIIQIIPNLGFGGAETFCINLSNEVSKNNEVHLISMYDYDKEKMLPIESISNNVKIYFLSKKIGFDMSIFRKLYKLISKIQPDVINTHLNSLLYVGAFSICFKKTKFFHTIHNLAEKEVSENLQKLYYCYFNYLNIKPIAISKQVFNSVIRRYNPKNKILIYNGIDKPEISYEYEETNKIINNIRKKNNNPIFLNIGRINPQKNQRVLVEIFSKYPNLQLIVLGDADDNNKILKEELIKNASNNIHFLGNRKNVGDYLLLTDFFILSSTYEGMPITLIEALSLGRICLVTPVGGIKDIIIHMKNGILSEDCSDNNIENMIIQASNLNIIEKNKLKKEAFDTYIQTLTMQKCASLYVQTYKKY